MVMVVTFSQQIFFYGVDHKPSFHSFHVEAKLVYGKHEEPEHEHDDLSDSTEVSDHRKETVDRSFMLGNFRLERINSLIHVDIINFPDIVLEVLLQNVKKLSSICLLAKIKDAIFELNLVGHQE
jgi:hypothetical protein